MRKSQLLISLFLLTLVCGCSTLDPGNFNPKRFGRIVTIGYLASKDSLKPEHVTAIELVYGEFDKIISEKNNADNLKPLIISMIKEKAGDNLALILVSSEIVDIYWQRLTERYDIGSVVGEERLMILREFNAGIKEALKDYEFMANKDIKPNG